jgi:hypothetical protein
VSVATGEVGARQAGARVIGTPGPSAGTHGPPPAARSPAGAPLDVATRAFMEPRFNRDFSDVAVFSDRAAGASALALGADAYTCGRTIAFAPGRYDPVSDAGRALIAHELAHVVQQRGTSPRVQRQAAAEPQALDAGYALYLNPQSTRYHRASGRYELSPWDHAHLLRRAGFYFLVTEEIHLITPPEVRRAAPTGAPGAGVLLPITPADLAQVPAAPDATIARIVREQLRITVARMTHAAGPDRDFSVPELPGPMAQALSRPASPEGAQARGQAASMRQAPTLDIARQRRDELSVHEIGWGDRMSQRTIHSEMSAGARAAWYVQKLGPYQAQLYASAQRHHLPVQLLAVVILNELSDINIVDVAQSGEDASWGSLGIAQIQVTTAMAENLVDVTPAEEEAAYHEGLRRTGHDHDPHHALNEYERRVGRRLRVARQLQVPQVAIEAAAREVEILLNRMARNTDKPWQRQFRFQARGAVGDAIYSDLGPPGTPAEAREGMLAMLVCGAYNSPNVIDTGDVSGFTNAIVHGTNARAHATGLSRMGLFHATGAAASPTPAPATHPPATAGAPAPAVTGMRFDGSQLALFGAPTPAMFAAVSGLRANNPHNRDHRDHTGPASQSTPEVGPLPEGSYFVNPGEVQRMGFNTGVWGPVRVPIHETVMTELARRWHTSRTGGFFVHEDVGRDGTAGCVGLQRRQDTLAVFARISASTEQIPLTVRYPHGGTPAPRRR